MLILRLAGAKVQKKMKREKGKEKIYCFFLLFALCWYVLRRIIN
jgi:hypothetical protein